MATVTDTQVSTLKDLEYSGSLADMQLAYMRDLTTEVSGTVTDLQVIAGQKPSLLVTIEDEE